MDILRKFAGFVIRNKARIALGAIIAIVLAVFVHFYAPRLLYGENRRRRAQKQRILNLTEMSQSPSYKRSKALMRIRKQFDQACQQFIPAIRKKIFDMIDINQTVRQIKSLRSSGALYMGDEEVKLWNEIKVSSFTMLFLSSYMLAAVCTMLRVQLHVLARAMLQLSTEEESNGDDGVTADSLMFLRLVEGTYRHLLGDGVESFMEFIRGRMDEELRNWSVKEKVRVDYEEFVELLRQLRKDIEGDMPSLIRALFLPAEASDDVLAIRQEFSIDNTGRSDEKTAVAMKILNQTWDMVESPVFAVCYIEVVDACFRISDEYLRRNIFSPSSSTMELDSGMRSPPLATVLPQLKVLSSRLLPETADAIDIIELKSMSSGPLLESFCMTIFDAEDANN